MTRTYAEAGPLRRLVRRTAATRPMTWLYTRIQRPADELVHRLTRGRATASSLLSGLPVVMLTTTGARTGRPRTVPVLAMPVGDGLVVIASNYGRPQHPAWYHNLRADPHGTVEIRGATRRIQAREVSGTDRTELVRTATLLHPGFAVFERRAQPRTIPVFKLVFGDGIAPVSP